jgi:hypothetical protein
MGLVCFFLPCFKVYSTFLTELQELTHRTFRDYLKIYIFYLQIPKLPIFTKNQKTHTWKQKHTK